MSLTLFIGDRAYSSWSLRGWLLADLSGLPFAVRHAHLNTPAFAEMLGEIPPARTVPALRIEAAGAAPALARDSLAIAEELAERAPGMWPEGREARAAARSMAAEMHSGFATLRALCPMNMRRRYAGWRAPEDEAEALAADVARIIALWRLARERWGAGGPFLFGARFCAADAFFAPVASRFATYGLSDDAAAAAYVAAIHAYPPLRRWRAEALADAHVQPHYEFDLPALPLPGPAPRPARAVAGATPINATCPFSGKPVRDDSLAGIDGRVLGFCNPACRDKAVADAEAWPELAPLLA